MSKHRVRQSTLYVMSVRPMIVGGMNDEIQPAVKTGSLGDAPAMNLGSSGA